jgi:membrane-associated phospholipid phosphatase
VVGGVLLYFGGRGLTESDPGPAREHAQDLVALERALGLFWEPWLQGLVDGSHAVVTVANWIYIWGHWPVIILTLVWLVVRHPAQYRRTRNAMAVSGAIGMVVFVLYPVAPPRLVDLGLVDTVTLHSEAYRVLQPPAFSNLYAAMPSLHVGWNLLMGIAIASAARHWLLRSVGYALPVLMAASVVLTANHFLVDVVAGAFVALLGLVIATTLERRRGALRADTGHALEGATER